MPMVNHRYENWTDAAPFDAVAILWRRARLWRRLVVRMSAPFWTSQTLLAASVSHRTTAIDKLRCCNFEDALRHMMPTTRS